MSTIAFEWYNQESRKFEKNYYIEKTLQLERNKTKIKLLNKAYLYRNVQMDRKQNKRPIEWTKF